MKNKLVSVVVPIYNVEKYLKKCINTIINQTYQNLEIILVDDGSTDDSGNIADEYLAKDKRITVIHKENGGLSDARNAGMRMATGNYICFIDSDDYVELDMVEQAVNVMNLQQLDVVIWGFYVDTEDDEGNLIESNKNVLETKIINVNESINEIDVNLYFLNHLGYAWNKLYNLDFLKKYNFEFEKGLSAIEDGEFNTRVFMKANRFGILGRAFNHYIQRNRETLGNKRYDNDIELSIIICKNTKEMLQAWNLDKNKIEKICLKQRLFVSLGIVKDIITNYDLTKEEKIAKIENMLAIPEMKQAYECKKIQNKKEKIFCFCVRKHYIFPLKIYYKYFEKQRYGVQKKK